MFHLSGKKMDNDGLKALVGHLRSSVKVSADVWRALLVLESPEQRAELASAARHVAKRHFRNGVYVRALIEISSYCRNNCRYCGLRCGNAQTERYRLDKEQILVSCRKAALLGFNTFVLQGGEDSRQSDLWLAGVVSAIKSEFPDKAVTLSVGERTADGYELLRRAGTDRYLLRHETADESHYSFLHLASMSAANRRRCLLSLKQLGYQVGSGMMIGSPGQTVEHLVADLMLLDELKPQMIGVGPFIPASGTPFEHEPAGSVEQTLHLISLLRLRFPHALIPATTALATLLPDGTERGILAGANVVMPNFTPVEVRKSYSIYDNKKCNGSESAEQLHLLADKLDKIGYRIDFSRGDYDSDIKS